MNTFHDSFSTAVIQSQKYKNWDCLPLETVPPIQNLMITLGMYDERLPPFPLYKTVRLI